MSIIGNPYLLDLEQSVQSLIDDIGQHKVFLEISSIENLKIFAEHHIYAVWDFMCLIKSLQRKLVCTETAWYPSTDPAGCYLINSIVAEEESDLTWDGEHASHFEMYLASMQECGAQTNTILDFIESVKQKRPLDIILHEHPIPQISKNFIHDTFKIIGLDVHQIAASFAFARESITDSMFLPILQNIKYKENVSKFIYYFQRHIELDAEKHVQEAKMLVTNLCGDSKRRWFEAKEAAQCSLMSRIALLDGIYEEIKRTAALPVYNL